MMMTTDDARAHRPPRRLRQHRGRRSEYSRGTPLTSFLPSPVVLLLLLIGTYTSAAAAAGTTTTTFKGKTSSVKYAIDKSGGGGTKSGDGGDRHWSRRALDAVLSSINSEDDAETTASRTVFDVVRGRARVSSGDSLVDDSSSGKKSRKNKRKEVKRTVPAAADADDAPSSMFGWRRREADPSDVSRAKPKAVPVDDSEKTYFERIGRRIAERIERTKDVVCKPAF